MQDKPVVLITGPTRESVFKSRRTWRRMAPPCSSGRPSFASLDDVRAVFETNVFKRDRRHISHAAAASPSARK